MDAKFKKGDHARLNERAIVRAKKKFPNGRVIIVKGPKWNESYYDVKGTNGATDSLKSHMMDKIGPFFDKEDFYREINALEKEIDEREKQIKKLKDKIDWMNSHKLDQFDEDMFNAFTLIEEMEGKNLSVREKALKINKLLKEKENHNG